VAAYLDAHSRIPKVVEPLELEDGQAWLVKTDILSETLYFSYEKGSLAQMFPLSADEVKEIQEMNRRGERPETLRQEGGAAPEFITGTDDAINRFDPEKKKRRRKNRGRNRKSGQKPSNAE
jgi:hypothetical protein